VEGIDTNKEGMQLECRESGGGRRLEKSTPPNLSPFREQNKKYNT